MRSNGRAKLVDVAGKRTQLYRGGEGPPLLYLHSAAGETEWTSMHDRLAESFTVYAPAHPGFARSQGLEKIDDIGDVVWHYVDLLDVLGLEQIPVVGFSLGAWIGAELAVLRPQLVDRLMMIASSGLYVEGAPIGDLFTDDVDELREMIFFDASDSLADQFLPRSLEDPRVLLYLRAREATARVGWNPYMHNPKLAEHLHRVQCPTLVVWGRHDRLVPLAHGQRYRELIPGARLEIFEDCGHMLPFEKTDRFVKLVEQFCAGQGCTCSTKNGQRHADSPVEDASHRE